MRKSGRGSATVIPSGAARRAAESRDLLCGNQKSSSLHSRLRRSVGMTARHSFGNIPPIRAPGMAPMSAATGVIPIPMNTHRSLVVVLPQPCVAM